MKKNISDLEEFLVLNDSFINGFKRQIRLIHHVAYFLNLANIDFRLHEITEDTIYQFFRDYTTSENEADQLMLDFAEYRCQTRDYKSTR